MLRSPWNSFLGLETPLAEALRSSAALLPLGEMTRTPAVGVWQLSSGPAVVLGRLQVAGRVLSCPQGHASFRRLTSGPAAHVDGGLLWSFAVPELDVVYADATPRNALNRHVRALLRALAATGLPSVYWGRDFVAHQRAAVGQLGIEMTPSGALLVECLFTERGPLTVPREWATDLERSTPRHSGKPSLALGETRVAGKLADFAQRLLQKTLEQLGADSREQPKEQLLSMEVPAEIGPPVIAPSSPLPPSARLLAPEAIPIGWLDHAEVPDGIWVGGDALAPSFAMGLSSHDQNPALQVILEGAEWSDVQRLRAR